jgi:hypothetical protein
VLELDICLLERAGTHVTLNETAEMDEQRHWRIAAAPLGCDGALAVDVGA